MSAIYPTTSPILTLARAKYLRQNLPEPLKPNQLAARADITRQRLIQLESIDPNKATEPWLDEAVRIALALQTEVLPLIGVATLADADLGFDPRNDLDIWRTGCRLPLSTACRLCLRFGIDDPIRLEHLRPTGLMREVVGVLASGERGAARGHCGWCLANMLAGEPHLDTCLADFLFGPRNASIATIGAAPIPRAYGKRRRGSMPGRGLKAVREALGYTQAEFAASIEKHPNYYARLEQGRDPLNAELADRIAALYRVDPMTLFFAPEDLAQEKPAISGS